MPFSDRLKQTMRAQGLAATNAAIRIVLLMAKFVFVIFLAKYTSPDVVIQYGIIVATVSVAITLVGLDFYTFATREIMRDRAQAPAIMTNQIALVGIIYLFVFPAVGGLYVFGVSLVTVALVVSTEHISQEFIRVLVARRNPILATIALAPKAALWIVALLGWTYFADTMITFPKIAAFWIVGNLISASVGIWFLRHDLALTHRKYIDIPWIKRGLKTAAIFLLSGIIGRSFFLLDRVLIRDQAGIDTVSAYILFSSLFAAVYVVVEAAVFNFALPDLVEKYQKQGFAKYAGFMAFKAMVIAGAAIAFILLFSDLVLAFIGKETYASQAGVLYICAAISLAYVAFLSTHFILYAMRRDLWLLVTVAITLGIFLTGSIGQAGWVGPLSVPIYLAISLVTGVLLRLCMIWIGLKQTVRK